MLKAARRNYRGRRALWLVCVMLSVCGRGRAEQLPARLYTTADGLLSNVVVRIVPDARGFLWFCTAEGLSRFDGYGFTNYTTDEGLPDRRVNDLLVTSRGAYWLATEGGLVRFDTGGARPMFTTYRPGDGAREKSVGALFEDGGGGVWVGTGAGLYRLDEEGGEVRFRRVGLMQSAEADAAVNVTSIREDPRGALWVGSDAGLFRLTKDGRVEHYTTAQGLPLDDIRALLVDRNGRVWAGTGSGPGGGLLLLADDPDSNGAVVVARSYSKRDGLPADWVTSLYQSSDGGVWAGTPFGLARLLEEGGREGQLFRVYDEREGLCGRDYTAVTEDRDGNLWAASRCGVMKVARYGFTRYTQADGLDSLGVNSIFESASGELYVSTNEKWRAVNRFDGERFTSVKPLLPAGASAYAGWGWKQTVLLDHAGDWWVPNGAGLFRFAHGVGFEQLSRGGARMAEVKRRGAEIFRVFEDSRGDVWVSTTGSGTDLLRWERAANTWHDYTDAAGIFGERVPASFAEDGSGNLWIGTGGAESALLRYRDESFTVFTHADGAPRGWLKDIYADAAGRLWVASNESGLVRVDDPASERPRFVAYTTAEGLSSNNVLCVTGDEWGRIYAGTGRALDRLDPSTGQVKHFTSADGLPKGRVEEATRARAGALWFGTTVGLARLTPEPERTHGPPTILITGLRVAGVARRVSALGETEIPRLELDSNETQVGVDFLGLGASLGEDLRYEYELEGADSRWTQTSQRTVNFANLAPGTYRLLVRAANDDGVYSPAPASVSFRIAAPVWRRWWFVALCALAASVVGFALYRYRVARLLEVANMRTRIATDLHDDIGSGLSRVAILSEVVKRQTGESAPQAEPLLDEIADSARTLVSSMRDIVWAIDPALDDVGSLLARVRQFASDVLEPERISLDFPATPELERVKLDPEQRRHVYLIFKEAINNVARHAGCSTASLKVSLDAGTLTAEVRDDGRGFNAEDPRAPSNGGGHGLENIGRRVEQLGGRLEINSSPGGGTCLRMTIPLKKR